MIVFGIKKAHFEVLCMCLKSVLSQTLRVHYVSSTIFYQNKRYLTTIIFFKFHFLLIETFLGLCDSSFLSLEFMIRFSCYFSLI